MAGAVRESRAMHLVDPADGQIASLLESVFFAFMKFIMCLLVSEVKAVSCGLSS